MNMFGLGVKAIAEDEVSGLFLSFWLHLPPNGQELSFLTLTIL